jgi:hypothetical protein
MFTEVTFRLLHLRNENLENGGWIATRSYHSRLDLGSISCPLLYGERNCVFLEGTVMYMMRHALKLDVGTKRAPLTWWTAAMHQLSDTTTTTTNHKTGSLASCGERTRVIIDGKDATTPVLGNSITRANGSNIRLALSFVTGNK